MRKSVFECLTERGIIFHFTGNENGTFTANIPNAPAEPLLGVTYDEAMAYFEEILAFAIGEGDDDKQAE